jgi:hypothetical protein
MTRLLDFLVDSFVAAFGITEPRPGQRPTVRLVLGGALLFAICLAFGIGGFFWFQLHH